MLALNRQRVLCLSRQRLFASRFYCGFGHSASCHGKLSVSGSGTDARSDAKSPSFQSQRRLNLMGGLGGVIYLIFSILMFTEKNVRNNYTLIFLMIGGLMAVSVIVLFLTVKETRISAEVRVDRLLLGGD